MRKAIKIIYRTLLSFFGLIFLYVFFAFVFSIIPSKTRKNNEEKKYEIFIKSNGIHTDIIFNQKDVRKSFQLKLDQKLSNYLAFGWGDKGFYIDIPTWDDLTFSIALNAMVLNSETCMHVTAYQSIHSNWFSVNISKKQLDELLNFIESSFQLEGNRFKKIDFEGYNNMDAFYEAKGSYNLFKTCNVWTGQALKQAEIKTGMWSPFDWGIVWNL